MTETSKRISVRIDAQPDTARPHPQPPPPGGGAPFQIPSRMLAAWMTDNGVSQRRLAELSGISRKLVNMLCRGQRRVTVETAFRLEKATKIPAERWVVSSVLAEVNEYRRNQ